MMNSVNSPRNQIEQMNEQVFAYSIIQEFFLCKILLNIVC